jgi:UDP-N-acetylglucosamine--N-acetylmuramyl-(pentapeptide) pyrophosphoryl-undecaprenol N-acetylglucosamine transferase
MILDRDFSPPRLAEAVVRLRAEPDSLAAMARAARSLGRPEAADRVVDVCLELVQGRQRGN